jgi:iron complex outermembrane recepter protein
MIAGCAFSAEPEHTRQRFHLSIDRSPLSSALIQFALQTRLQVLTQLNVSDSKTDEVGPFKGHATADEALSALLKGSDLSYTWQDQETIRVFVKDVRPPHAEDNVQSVLVTGSRLGWDEDQPAPVRVYGPRRIERYGVSSVSDFSRYLTQQPFSFGAGHLQSGAQFFQMRGLGFDTTLVLINGRRAPPSANSISLNAVDLNTIPLTAVDRIEVMSDSASAIYGADAIGGVVNVILKDKIEDPEVYLHYGHADGGGTQRRGAISYGWVNEKLKSALVLDYYEQGMMLGEERDLWRNQDYRRFGGRDYRVSTASPGNVYSLTGRPLPGLASSYAAVPLGTSETELTPADFIATDGTLNMQSAFSAWSATPRSYRTSAYGSAEYSLTPGLSLFGEVLATDSEVIIRRSPPSVLREVVPASNPFNPFDVPVAVDYSFADMGPTFHTTEADLLRLVSGARGAIDRWEWEISGLRSSERSSFTTQGGIDRPRLAAAVVSEDPQTALNFFSDGPAGSSALLNSLIAAPQRLDFGFVSSQLSAFIRGPLFNLGQRRADFVLGSEWRRDAAEFFESTRMDVDRDITSAFAEVRVPLVDELALKVALRADQYGDGEEVVNPQYGITWKPKKDWLFRAAYGTSFRPPSLFELHMPVTALPLPMADPRRGGQVTNVNLVVGGNPNLDVVTARSFTTGFVFTPFEVPEFRVGGSYWRVVMENRIMVPLYQELLRSEELFDGRVERDPPSEQDLQAGWAGRLRSVDITRVNYGKLETSGIDLDASFLMERMHGTFQLNLALTWIEKYLSRDMNQVLPLDRVGIANVQGTIPDWRAVGTVTWKLGGFGASTTATFTPSYQDADVATGVLDRNISSQTLVDLQAWMDLGLEGDSLFEGSRLTLGARNVFDRSPEFANAGGPLGYDFSQGELTQRFVYFRFNKRF